MLDEGSPNMHNSHKRPHQYGLLPEDGPPDCENFPMKKPKLLLTTFTCDRSSESEVYFNQRMLELSRISRQTFAAKMEYQRLRAKELELITSLMKDEMEESQAHLSLRNSLHDAGIAVIGDKGRKGAKKVNGYGRVLPIHRHHKVVDSGDSCGSSVSSGCNGSADDDQLHASSEQSYYSQAAAPSLNP
ncbi:hypothetical protein EV702DRAFT_1201053 [Suillus placidus]|uniref:Uncharacterized protein n=1 Tax=Suillus placidus TaxID=48579 RepID=A0A9P6ZNS4_9AGAM|nr:hypothetical protein EV702DRAFT_1201053 [Suillus placidus]